MLTDNVTVNEEALTVLNKEAMLVLTPAFVYISVLINVGIPGNILVLLVYGTQLRTATGRYAIIVLAICDIINCALSIPVEMFIITNYWAFEYSFLCKLSRFTTYALNNSSGLILLAIACERYRAICTPHKSKTQESFIRKCCGTMVALGTFAALPALFIYGIQTDVIQTQDNAFANRNYTKTMAKSSVENIGQNRTLKITSHDETNATSGEMWVTTKRCLIDDAWKGTSFAYSHFALVTIASTIVLLIIVVVYIQIGRTIHNLKTCRLRAAITVLSINEREKLRATNKKKFQSTLLLFLITLAFQFSFIPFLVISNIRFFAKPSWYREMSRASKMSYHFFLRSYYLNCAVNPFIYGLTSKQFRRSVVKLISRGHQTLKTIVNHK